MNVQFFLQVNVCNFYAALCFYEVSSLPTRRVKCIALCSQLNEISSSIN
jgi:hypothetical protein